MRHLIFIWSVFLSSVISAQMVATFGSTPSNADVAVDRSGNVYVASEGGAIHRFSSSGVLDSTPFVNGGTIVRASGLGFDPTGDTLYVTCRTLNGQGWISKVDPNGNDAILVSNIYFPGDISVDSLGTLYVTDFNNNVLKYDKLGNGGIYVNAPVFNTPIGIAWTPGDTLFVASAHDGNIYKVSPDTVSGPIVQWFAKVNGLVQNWACGFMTYSKGNLYITNGDNKIHRITMQGVVSDYAGTGVAGNIDGAFSVARFQAPNGIGMSTDGTKMYVTEYGQNRVRLLREDVSSTGEPKIIQELKVYPNPTADKLLLEFQLKRRGRVEVSVCDSQGREVVQLSKGVFNQGVHQIEWKTTAPPGVYILKVTGQTQVVTTKIIRL